MSENKGFVFISECRVKLSEISGYQKRHHCSVSLFVAGNWIDILTDDDDDADSIIVALDKLFGGVEDVVELSECSD